MYKSVQNGYALKIKLGTEDWTGEKHFVHFFFAYQVSNTYFKIFVMSNFLNHSRDQEPIKVHFFFPQSSNISLTCCARMSVILLPSGLKSVFKLLFVFNLKEIA